MQRRIAWVALLGLCACFTEPESVTGTTMAMGSTSGDSTGEDMASSVTSASTSMSSTEGDSSSSSSASQSTSDGSTSGGSCQVYEPGIALLDADVIVAIDPNLASLRWDALIMVLDEWRQLNVNFAVVMAEAEIQQLPVPFDCEPSCQSVGCDMMEATVRVPYDEGTALDALEDPLGYGCMLRPSPPGEAGPTRHIWLLTDDPAQPIDIRSLPDIGSGRFHVSCPECDDDESFSSELAELVDSSLGRISDLNDDSALLEHGAFVGRPRYTCGWLSPPPPSGSLQLVGVLNNSIASLNMGDGLVAEEVNGFAGCTELVGDPATLKELPVEFFRTPEDDATVLCPTACVLAQIEPAATTELFELYCEF